MNYPVVLSELETIRRASKMSLSRFGDGELRVALGGFCISQKPDWKLARELRTILMQVTPGCLVCIPSMNPENPKFAWWARYFEGKYAGLYGGGQEYGSAFVSRPDNAPWINTAEYWEAARNLWRGKDIVLVVGQDKKSINLELLSDAASVREVVGPRRDAYAAVDALQEQIGKPSGTVILCLGPTATVLAWRLARKGVHALDLGHLGGYLRGWEKSLT